MATSAQTRNPRPDEEAGETRSNGQQVDETAAQVSEQATAAAADAADLVPAIARQTRDGVLRSVQLWTELMTRLTPFAVLSPARRGGDVQPAEVPAAPARAWVDGAFDLTEMLLANERNYVDQVLAANRYLIGQVLDAGATVAAATRANAVPVRAGAADIRTSRS